MFKYITIPILLILLSTALFAQERPGRFGHEALYPPDMPTKYDYKDEEIARLNKIVEYQNKKIQLLEKKVQLLETELKKAKEAENDS